jgi:transcriptional regulator with XRE-family HTH domain
MSFQEVLGSCIREARERAGLNIEQLSEKSGLSTSRIFAIEHGDVDMNMGTLLLLALSLDLTVPEIFSCITRKLNNTSKSPESQVLVFPGLRKARTQRG